MDKLLNFTNNKKKVLCQKYQVFNKATERFKINFNKFLFIYYLKKLNNKKKIKNLMLNHDYMYIVDEKKKF